MHKVADWNGRTQSHGIHVEVYHDTKTDTFIAQIKTSSLPLLLQHIPGTPTPIMDFDNPEEIRHKELDELRELTKQAITSRCGQILNFSEESPL